MKSVKEDIENDIKSYKECIKQRQELLDKVIKFGRDLINFKEDSLLVYDLGYISVNVSANGDENERRYFVDSRRMDYEDRFGIVWNTTPNANNVFKTVEYEGYAKNNGIKVNINIKNAPIPPSCKLISHKEMREVEVFEVQCNETGEKI